jgi:hypothetical protein
VELFGKVLSPRNRAADSARQASGAYASPIHDDWSDEPKKTAYESPSDMMRRKESADRIATSHRMSSERDAHEKRTGLPSTFLPNVSRTAPEGTSQAAHDSALQKAHDRVQASKSGVLHVDSRPANSSSLQSGTHYELWEHPGDNASTHNPRNSHTISNPKVVHLPNSDGLGTTPHLEYSLAAGGFGSRHTRPLSEVHSLETSRSENQPQRQGVSDQSNEWWRN